MNNVFLKFEFFFFIENNHQIRDRILLILTIPFKNNYACSVQF